MGMDELLPPARAAAACGHPTMGRVPRRGERFRDVSNVRLRGVSLPLFRGPSADARRGHPALLSEDADAKLGRHRDPGVAVEGVRAVDALPADQRSATRGIMSLPG